MFVLFLFAGCRRLFDCGLARACVSAALVKRILQCRPTVDTTLVLTRPQLPPAPLCGYIVGGSFDNNIISCVTLIPQTCSCKCVLPFLEVRRRLGLVRLTRRILFGQPPLSITAPVLIRIQYATTRGNLFVDFASMHLAVMKNEDCLLFP